VSLSTDLDFDTSASWQLSEQVSLRDEAFGALAYHHGNRRLVFLKSPELVALVRRLAEFDSADAAIEALTPPAQHERYARALASLQRSELLSGR
jgi:putative mycofactocin binding protein MftB